MAWRVPVEVVPDGRSPVPAPLAGALPAPIATDVPMPVILILVLVLAYLGFGVRRLRGHPDGSTYLLAAAMRPATGIPLVLLRVVLWPFLLRRPVPSRPRGAERL